jgi:FGGY-family pentulose kinase
MTMNTRELFLGVDVGTGSVRAALFDGNGEKAGQSTHEIRIWRPREDFAEQSSEDIWRAAGTAIRGALREAGATPERVRGVGFDATCSLVAIGANGEPVSVSPTHSNEQNVILWMDHRAVEQAQRINRTRHEVLKYVGGVISPEMEMPKLLWLKEHHAECWHRATDFFDLPDYLTFRATGSRTRSLCTTVCKWTYFGHDGGRWSDDFLRQIGLDELAHADHAKIGTLVRPLGESVGETTESAARELGLAPGTPVGVSIIDAHAGGLGLLGTSLGPERLDQVALERRLALIGGTSSCHMAVSREPRFVAGVWGPYFSAMVPGMWLTEGGQSATGALIDHVINTHPRGPELAERAKRDRTTVYALLNAELEHLGGPELHALTAELHVMPDFHGNRSPRADPTLRGMLSGLKLTDSMSSLAVLYLATVQAIAYGTRHILEALERGGYRIDTVLACGGDTKNPLFVREHADITGCRIALPREPEAVLLGSALLGAVAAGRYANILAGMSGMSGAREIVEPRKETAPYHARKYAVFQRMHDDQLAYRALMASST